MKLQKKMLAVLVSAICAGVVNSSQAADVTLGAGIVTSNVDNSGIRFT